MKTTLFIIFNKFMTSLGLVIILFYILFGLNILRSQDTKQIYHFFYSKTFQDKLDVYIDADKKNDWVFRCAVIVNDDFVYYTEKSKVPHPVRTWQYTDNVYIGYGTVDSLVFRGNGYYAKSNQFTFKK
jgi:hypothetical protein